MKTVWEFPFNLAGQFTLDLPRGAQLLAAQEQNGQACLWMLVDPATQSKDLRTFRVYLTGHDVPDEPGLLHRATFVMVGRAWHLFEVLTRREPA